MGSMRVARIHIEPVACFPCWPRVRQSSQCRSSIMVPRTISIRSSLTRCMKGAKAVLTTQSVHVLLLFRRYSLDDCHSNLWFRARFRAAVRRSQGRMRSKVLAMLTRGREVRVHMHLDEVLLRCFWARYRTPTLTPLTDLILRSRWHRTDRFANAGMLYAQYIGPWHG